MILNKGFFSFSNSGGQQVHFQGVLDGLKANNKISNVSAFILNSNYSAVEIDSIYNYSTDVNLKIGSILDFYRLAYNFDIIYIRRSPLCDLFAPLIKLIGKQVYVEVNSVFLDYKVTSRKKLLKSLYYIHTFIVGLFVDNWVCVNKRIANYMTAITKSNVLLVENGGPKASKRELCFDTSSRKYLILFYGRITQYNNYDFLNIDDKSVEVHIIGNGDLLESLNSIYASRGNVFFHGYKSRDQFKHWIESKGDYLIFGIIPMANFSYGYSIEPIKLFEYLSFGLPVLHSIYCLAEFNKPYSFVYESTDEVIKLISSFSIDKYKSLTSEILLDYEQNYTWKKRYEKFL